MRKLLVPLVLVPSLCAAQQPSSPSFGWQRVQALRAGTSINVKARTSHAGCKLKSVDADTLTCTQGKDLVFQRADILQIKVAHRGRSAVVGLAAGAGAGAIAGVASSSPCSGICIVGRGTEVLVFAVGLGVIGAITGLATDFTHSTVYKAP
jgi:hypothetical protein